MSDWQAIAAVTNTLRELLDPAVTNDIPAALSSYALGDTAITTRAPGKARKAGDPPQLNLFLYGVAHSEAWRNIDMQESLRRTGSASAPMALDLYYLLTAYGVDDNDMAGHFLLARAMRIFNDNAVLGRDVLNHAMPSSDVSEQVERIRIIPHALSNEEITKLWSSLMAEYRLTTAYQVSVVLIDGTRAARAPLPVLKRGELDRGPAVQASLTPPYPVLTGASVPGRQPAARMGDTLTLTGYNLAGSAVNVHLINAKLGTDTILAPLAGGTSTSISVTIPDPTTPAGQYTVLAEITKGGRVARTNELPISVAPTLHAILPANLTGMPPVLSLTTNQQILPEQRASALVGDLEFFAEPHGLITATLTFKVGPVPSGPHHVRLRVDGVDSFIVKYAANPPVFDDDFRVVFP